MKEGQGDNKLGQQNAMYMKEGQGDNQLGQQYAKLGQDLRLGQGVGCLLVGCRQPTAGSSPLCSPLLAALPCSASTDPSASNAATSSPALGGAYTTLIGEKSRNPKTGNTEFH